VQAQPASTAHRAEQPSPGTCGRHTGTDKDEMDHRQTKKQAKTQAAKDTQKESSAQNEEHANYARGAAAVCQCGLGLGCSCG
jgi:mannitol-specific phosphotransferase system IIBC component